MCKSVNALATALQRQQKQLQHQCSARTRLDAPDDIGHHNFRHFSSLLHFMVFCAQPQGEKKKDVHSSSSLHLISTICLLVLELLPKGDSFSALHVVS
jgi:hypothetical protein